MDIPIPSSNENQKEDQDLPQCKIKRNYSCGHCLYFTQNPRFYLTHLRDVHGERITISNCSLCLYASRHYQKLVRHMKMVHGSTAEGIPGQIRKRPPIEDVIPIPADCTAIAMPPLPSPSKWIIDIDNLSYDLKSSRRTLKDIAAIYFAENSIDEILAKMEISDVVEVVPEPVRDALPSIGVSARAVFGDPKYVGGEELDITCFCGHVSNCFLDLLTHRKFCSTFNEKNFENAPLDLSTSSSNEGDSVYHSTNGIRERVLEKQDSKYVSQIPDEDLTKNNLRIYKNVFEHSKGSEKKTDEEKNKTEEAELYDDEVVSTPNDEARALVSHKKVFKCPLCPFWASTASRFHVHIVGHQNKKPFKCSFCAYCSNWRWDITKHIRLRSLRSPSHKNARVLMQGETGRRNYTKYDRFITLIKISEHDSDFKLKKCGEITSNEEDSKMISSDLPGDDLKEQTIDEKETFKEENQKLTEKVQISKAMANPPEVVQHDNNGTASKQCNPRSYLILEDGENPFYKCSKCYFRHSNRDAVLVHVKIHHQDLLKNSMISSKLRKSSAGCFENQEKLLAEEAKNSSEANQHSSNNTELMIVDVENDNSAITSTSTPLNSPVNDSLKIKDNEGEIITNERASSSCNDEYDAKIAAPFRCWHCHQTSNWKHVIQRHCRLKHSGLIRIEAIDRSIDAKNPIYRMLNLSSTPDVFHPNNKTDKLCIDKNNDKHQEHSIDSSTEQSTKNHDITLKDSKKSRLNVKRSQQKLLKLECKDCSYVCTNHLELNTHRVEKHELSSSIVGKESKKSIGRKETVKSDNSTLTGKNDISEENNMTLQKCNYCSFTSRCYSAMKCHEQSHYKVLNQTDYRIPESNNREDTKSIFEKNEVVGATEDNSASNVNIEVALTEPVPYTIQKMETPPLTEKSLKKDSEINRRMDKIDKEIQKMKIKHSKTTSSVDLRNYKKTSSLSARTKTIFVNPKTGQIVRKN